MCSHCQLLKPLAIRLCVFALTLTIGIVLHNSFRSTPRESEELLLTMRINPENVVALPNSPYTIYDCGVHGEHMQKQYVYVASAFPRADKDYLNARVRFFPNSNFFIVDRKRADGLAPVYYCTRCRAAESEWLRHDYSSVSQTMNTIP